VLLSLHRTLTESQSKFVSANEQMTRLTTELGAARRDLIQAEQVKAKLSSNVERLAATQTDRDGLRVQFEAERRRT